jgi:hypothetical protein
MRRLVNNAAADNSLRRYLCLGFNRVDADPFSVAAKFFVFHNAVDHGKQGVITPTANVFPGVDHGADLAHQDVAGPDNLPAEPLDTPPLRITVTTVF